MLLALVLGVMTSAITLPRGEASILEAPVSLGQSFEVAWPILGLEIEVCILMNNFKKAACTLPIEAADIECSDGIEFNARFGLNGICQFKKQIVQEGGDLEFWHYFL